MRTICVVCPFEIILTYPVYTLYSSYCMWILLCVSIVDLFRAARRCFHSSRSVLFYLQRYILSRQQFLLNFFIIESANKPVTKALLQIVAKVAVFAELSQFRDVFLNALPCTLVSLEKKVFLVMHNLLRLSPEKVFCIEALPVK